MNKERARRANKREITLAGKVYPVYTDMAAWLDFEESTGKSLLAAIGEQMTMSDTAALLWACIGGSDTGLSVRDMAGLIDMGEIGTVVEQVLAAWNDTMPTVVEGEASEGEKSDPPASGKSGQ